MARARLRTLTIVKTDLYRFTDRVEQMSRDELQRLVTAHEGLVCKIIDEHGGRVFKRLGDSILAAFESSTDALLGCIALQKELAASQQPAAVNATLHMRTAVAAGDVLVEDGDFFGNAVNIAARLEALTPPGNIYLTESVYQNLNRSEVACEFVDTFTLKGVADPTRVYRTSVRQQTRTLCNVAILMTDLHGLTRFASTAAVDKVESVLDFWESVHRLVAVEQGGTIRETVGDAYVLTFATVEAAVRSWLAIVEACSKQNRSNAQNFEYRFSAGIAVGDVRVFRHLMYSPALNECQRMEGCSRKTGRGYLSIRKSHFDSCSLDVKSQVQVNPAKIEIPDQTDPIEVVILSPP